MMKISKFKEKIRNLHDQMGNFGLKYASVVLLSGVFKGLKPAMRKMAIDLLDCEFGYIFQNHNAKEYSIPQEFVSHKNFCLLGARCRQNAIYPDTSGKPTENAVQGV